MKRDVSRTQHVVDAHTTFPPGMMKTSSPDMIKNGHRVPPKSAFLLNGDITASGMFGTQPFAIQSNALRSTGSAFLPTSRYAFNLEIGEICSKPLAPIRDGGD
jgi:hypothetical protein